MVNLLGALVIIFGFLSPLLIRLPVGRTIPPTIFFCIGFLLLLKENRKFAKKSGWFKWGQVGALVNIIGFLLLILINVLVLNMSLSDTNFGHMLTMGTRWIFMPITSLSALFSLYYEQIKMSDGSLKMEINFLRWTLTCFFNVLLYIVLAVVIGKLLSTKCERYRQM
jgi:hypothetical protein